MSAERKSKGRLAFAMNAAATVQLVWFYIALVPSYLNLDKYEQGHISTPFQYRLLMMLPLRLAHHSITCQHVATWLSGLHGWFPRGVRPESLVELPIDVAAVAVAGFVARAIYRSSSRTGLLTPFVYPLTLLMIAATYALSTMHRLRFIYDLPSLGFFAAGLALIYFRKPRAWFAVLFLIATVNRETTLFLLLFLVLRVWTDAGPKFAGARAFVSLRWLSRGDGVLLSSLLASWAGWHVWVAHHFAANPSESKPRLLLNLWTILFPTSWLQLVSCFAFCGPLLLVYRRSLTDPVLRAWFLVLPVWGVFMLHYGVLMETRIFGELIPYIACVVALGVEREVLARVERVRALPQAAHSFATL